MEMMEDNFATGFIYGVGSSLLLFFTLFIVFAIMRPWLRMYMTGGRRSLTYVVGMRLRGTPPILIIDTYTAILHGGDEIGLTDVEAQYVIHRHKVRTANDLIELVKASRSNPNGK